MTTIYMVDNVKSFAVTTDDSTLAVLKHADMECEALTSFVKIFFPHRQYSKQNSNNSVDVA